MALDTHMIADRLCVSYWHMLMRLCRTLPVAAWSWHDLSPRSSFEMSNQYFVQRAGKISGPAKAELLQQYAANGKLRPTDEVALSRQGPWHVISKVPLLAQHLPAPDPLADSPGDSLAAASLMALDATSPPPASRAPAKTAKPAAQRVTGMARQLAGLVVLVGLLAVAAFLFLRSDPEAELKALGANIVRNQQDDIVVVTMSGQHDSAAREKMTDAGLVHLKNLDRLERLHIMYLPITDSGLTHIKGLSELEILKLEQINITDAGLVHLHGLTQLQELTIRNTQVTTAGLENLRSALPNCNIVVGDATASATAPVSISPEPDREIKGFAGGANATARATAPASAASARASDTGRELSQEVSAISLEPDLEIKGFAGRVNNVVWSPDSTRVAAATGGANPGKASSSIIHVWNAATGEEELVVSLPKTWMSGISWSADGSHLAVKAGGSISFTEVEEGEQSPGKLQVIDVKTGKARISVELDSEQGSWDREVLQWSPAGTSIAGLAGDAIMVWSAETGQPLQALSYADFDRGPVDVSWRPDGKLLAVGCHGGFVDLWDVATARIVKSLDYSSLKIGNQSFKLGILMTSQKSVQWSSDGNFIASASISDVQIWNARTRTARGTFREGASCLAWSPDGTQLAGAKDEEINLWNVQAAEPGKSFTAHSGDVVSLAWSPDGRRIVSAGKVRGRLFEEEKSTLKIWSVATD